MQTAWEAAPLTLMQRPRRMRRTKALRALAQETRLTPADLVAPLFVVGGTRQSQPIASMPGVFRLSLDLLLEEVEALMACGITAIDLFPVIEPTDKDARGSIALNPRCLLYEAVRQVKRRFPELCLMVDVALDPFTDHGHDGLVNEAGEVLNDATVRLLEAMSLLAAAAGADVVAPSDMMDGRISAIRSALDSGGYFDVAILSYAAKYASSFYAPFREALGSTPRFGDKKGYQLNPANAREALRECALDETEGADMLLIKPALPCLDILAKVRERTQLPLGAYQVSGEYAMLMAAAERGWMEGRGAQLEALLATKRAGADFIFTYGAKEIAPLLK